jgi:hypothetical protein
MVSSSADEGKDKNNLFLLICLLHKAIFTKPLIGFQHIKLSQEDRLPAH